MKNDAYDRVENDLLPMLDQEKKDRMLYPNYTGKERYILEDKLKHMISVYNKYKNLPTTADERRSLKKLKGKIADVENQLYPTAIKKVFARIKRGVENVREKYRYIPQPEMGQGLTVQQQLTLSNVQRLKNATKEKLQKTVEKILPNFIKPHKQDEAQTNIYSVKQSSGNQENGTAPTVRQSMKTRHRLRNRIQ